MVDLFFKPSMRIYQKRNYLTCKTKGPREIVLSLIKDNNTPQNIAPENMEKVDLKFKKNLNKLVKEKKKKYYQRIKPGPKDQLIKKYINQNPKISNAFQVTRELIAQILIQAVLFVNAIARLGL